MEERTLERTDAEGRAVIGCLLGTAVGDAMGLPCEGLTRHRQRRLFGKIEGHRLLFGRGMVSDDTEHTCMAAQALITSGGEEAVFTRDLARRLRGWLLTVPAGIGFATLRSILRLWMGTPPERSGVFSAGNGPAMRSALLGVCFGHEERKLRDLVRASTRITHTDPKAEWGARAVALAAHQSLQVEVKVSGQIFHSSLLSSLENEPAEEFLELIRRAVESADAGQATTDFAEDLGLARGVGGYVYHTVPVCIHAWLRHPEAYQEGVMEVIACGGDTDTTAAIVGGIIGARVGKEGIPGEWRDGLRDWPRTVSWMEGLGRKLPGRLRNASPTPPPELSFVQVFGRNLAFLCVVLFHGFRRLFPPYGSGR